MPLEPGLHQALEVRDLRYRVRLGCSAEERADPQDIAVTVEFRFPSPPAAIHSDRISDTICYAGLSDALERHFHDREYQLVERLAADAYGVAKELARGNARVLVRVHKLKPPLPNLAGGAVYSCGDFVP